MNEIFKLNYNISFEDYFSYNKTVFSLQLDEKAKRTWWQGILISVLAVILIIVDIVFYQSQVFYLVLGAVVAVLGVYISLFYKVIAPRMLKKSVVKSFDSAKDGFLNREVKFFEDHFTDLDEYFKGEIKYFDLSSIVETETLLLLMFSDMRAVIIPKSAGVSPELKEFLKQKMNENNKEYFSLNEKGENK